MKDKERTTLYNWCIQFSKGQDSGYDILYFALEGRKLIDDYIMSLCEHIDVTDVDALQNLLLDNKGNVECFNAQDVTD